MQQCGDWHETTVDDPGRPMAEQAAIDDAEMVLVCGGIVALALMNGRTLLAWMVSKPLNTAVQQCSLPVDQKIRLTASLDRLAL